MFPPRSAADPGPRENPSVGYGFQIETTWRTEKRAERDVPIHFTDRTVGVSKMSGQTFREALILVWRLRFGRL